MATSVILSADPSGTNVNATLYRGMICSLLYLTSNHPNIMLATIICAQYQANPKEYHLYAVKRNFRYLKNTPNLGLWYPHNSKFKLFGYTNYDHGGCGIDCKSTSIEAQLLGSRLISWPTLNKLIVDLDMVSMTYFFSYKQFSFF